MKSFKAPESDTMQALKKMRMFRSLNVEELQQVSQFLLVRRFHKGNMVIQEGAHGGSIYLVKGGELKVSHAVRGKERELATFYSGDHFGELSFLDGKPRSGTIYAAQDTELLVLTKASYRKMIRKFPHVETKILQQLLADLCCKLRQRIDVLDYELSDLLPVTVLELDKTGHIAFANRSGLDRFSCSREDFERGLDAVLLMAPEDRARFLEEHRILLSGNRSPQLSEYVAQTKEGVRFPVIAHLDPIVRNNQPVGVRVTLVDITERKKMEESLREAREDLEKKVEERTAELRLSQERYAIAAEGARDGLWDWNLETNELYFSPRWKSMIGYNQNQIPNELEEWFSRIHPNDLAQVKATMTMHIRGITPYWETEYRILHKDGNHRWVLCRGLAVRNSSGKACRIAGSHSDITDRKRMEEQLIRNAFYDSLTGLPNRALFVDRLQLVLERSRQFWVRQQPYSFAVLFLDLDRFKIINDSLGHSIGDQLLVAVAQRLIASIRPGDTGARLGGDEFAILLDQTINATDPIRVAGRVLDSLSKPFNLNAREIFIKASIGIALSSNEEGALRYEHSEEVLRDADLAMYRAKSQGKGRYEIFDGTLHSRAVALLQLETDLRLALERDELQPYYQPILSLESETIVGFEALARWNHPQRGMIQPDEFIPIAEETGLIIPMGRTILLKACRQLKKWNQRYSPRVPFFMSVNVSGRQLMEPEFLKDLEDVLDETGLDPRWLQLEITENVMMENSEVAISWLRSVKSLGIQLVVDDFGTGYSSLSCLRQFPIDTLKIDKSFIQGISDPDNFQIVNTIISLATNLNLSVVAEGVEEAAHVQALKALQCDLGQGFYWGKPKGVEDTEKFLLPETGQKFFLVS